jgi:uncharacterized caspase-like protein
MKRRIWTGSLLLGAALVALWATPSRAANDTTSGTTYAVVVGIDEYMRDTIGKLQFAVADAKLLAQALQDIVKVPKANIFVFTSDSVEETTQPKNTNIGLCLDELQKKVKPNDTVIFYFAGHGVTLDGESFLLTQEADNRSKTTLKSSSMRAGDLSLSLSSCAAEKTLTLLDACRNDPTGKSATSLDSAFTKNMTVSPRAGQQAATFFSCAVGQRSWEWNDKKHGFFTYFLVDGLRSGAIGPDGRVTVQSLGNCLAKNVPPATKRYAEAAQTPFFAYQGPSADSWLLAQYPATQAPVVAGLATEKKVLELDGLRAQLDTEIAARKAAEARANLAESRAQELETRLAILQKGASPSSDPQTLSLQKQLEAARQDLAAARTELVRARAELAARKGNPQAQAGSAGNLAMVANAEAQGKALQSENRVVDAQVQLTRAQLGATSREVTLVDPGLQQQMDLALDDARRKRTKAKLASAQDPELKGAVAFDARMQASEADEHLLGLQHEKLQNDVVALESAYMSSLQKATSANAALKNQVEVLQAQQQKESVASRYFAALSDYASLSKTHFEGEVAYTQRKLSLVERFEKSQAELKLTQRQRDQALAERSKALTDLEASDRKNEQLQGELAHLHREFDVLTAELRSKEDYLALVRHRSLNAGSDSASNGRLDAGPLDMRITRPIRPGDYSEAVPAGPEAQELPKP